jgi:dicarboxylate transporter 10
MVSPHYFWPADRSSYDIIKEQLLLSGHFTDSVPTHLLTAVIGGTIAVTACAPIDVMKSRIQSNTKPSVVSQAPDRSAAKVPLCSSADGYRRSSA